jgi:hypothetical protein
MSWYLYIHIYTLQYNPILYYATRVAALELLFAAVSAGAVSASFLLVLALFFCSIEGLA